MLAVWKLVMLRASTSARRVRPRAWASSRWVWMAAISSRWGLRAVRPWDSMAAVVHVGVVEVGDLALVGACGGVGFGGVVDDARDLFEAAIGEDAEDADGGTVGGEFCAGDVAAVGVEVEVVAGADGGVHVGDGDAGGGGLRDRCGGEGAEEEGKDAAGEESH